MEHLPGTMGHLPGTMGHLPGTMGHLSGTRGHLPGTMGYLPSPMGHLPGKTIKVICQLIYIGLPNFDIVVLKDDSMEVHYIGPY